MNERTNKRKNGYYRGIERDMYLYFTGYSETGAPSFSKFAKKCGISLKKLSSFRSRKIFDKAYAECMEIRRDYLIDQALTKKFDGSFVKYLLEREEKNTPADVAFTLEVV